MPSGWFNKTNRAWKIEWNASVSSMLMMLIYCLKNKYHAEKHRSCTVLNAFEGVDFKGSGERIKNTIDLNVYVLSPDHKTRSV
jgi:hypothetical protein